MSSIVSISLSADGVDDAADFLIVKEQVDELGDFKVVDRGRRRWRSDC